VPKSHWPAVRLRQRLGPGLRADAGGRLGQARALPCYTLTGSHDGNHDGVAQGRVHDRTKDEVGVGVNQLVDGLGCLVDLRSGGAKGVLLRARARAPSGEGIHDMQHSLRASRLPKLVLQGIKVCD